MCTRKLFVIGIASLALFSCKKEMVQPESAVQPDPVATTVYDESHILRLPGNYQGWDVAAAPKIVSQNSEGGYEGYVNFTNPESQFYLVKGTAWNNVTTYNETGPGTFGFNGTFFFVREGSGVYKVNVNMNNQTWSCTKINRWGLHGNACSAAADAAMIFDETNITWHTTVSLAKGEFVFRANQTDAITLGRNVESFTGTLINNGEKIKITEAGVYTVVLSLGVPGNYMYSIKKSN
jgi:hypothetical protein